MESSRFSIAPQWSQPEVLRYTIYSRAELYRMSAGCGVQGLPREVSAFGMSSRCAMPAFAAGFRCRLRCRLSLLGDLLDGIASAALTSDRLAPSWPREMTYRYGLMDTAT